MFGRKLGYLQHITTKPLLYQQGTQKVFFLFANNFITNTSLLNHGQDNVKTIMARYFVNFTCSSNKATRYN